MAKESRAAWALRVARWHRSGLTADRFAAQEGVNARTLAFWKWRLKRDGGRDLATRPTRTRSAGKRVAFVEFVAPKPVVMPSETRSTTTAIEVVLPVGYRVRVAGGFERGTLVDLLDLLEARR